MFCYQKNFSNPTLPVDEAQFFALVRATQWNENIDKFRETGEASLKRKLPAFIFQATFDETLSKKGILGAWRKQAATRLTGLVVMDVDHVDTHPLPLPRGGAIEKPVPQDYFNVWRDTHPELFGDQAPLPSGGEGGGSVLLVYITPSGKGLKIVFKARQDWGNLIDNQHQMAKLLGVEVDESCKDASRMSFICKESDILFIDKELFTYENKEYGEKFDAEYREGRSRGTHSLTPSPSPSREGSTGADESPLCLEGDRGRLTWRGYDVQSIIDCRFAGKLPCAADSNRHNESLRLASDLLVLFDGDKQKTLRALKAQKWVQEIIDERNENVEQTVASAAERMAEKEKKYLSQQPGKAMQEAIQTATGKTFQEITQGEPSPLCKPKDDISRRLEEWGQKIEAMFDTFPCLRECCQDLRPSAYPAALYTSAAFLGTDMTRTWWHFWHRPEQQRRLNYCIFIIGDPGVGKSFATRLYKLLAAPLITADKVGNDAINRYKKEVKKRGTSTKEQKKDALEQPDVVVRVMGSRTANGVFIENMNKAVETVDGKPIHLHLLTFDSELDSATTASKGGQWIDKSVMELKAFHNEEDDQQYRNVDSMNGPCDVFWNFVYTGTPLSLHRKVTERNFGSGLATRLAVIPFPSSNFQMLELRRQTKVNHEADELLKTWAFRLDGVKGELPLWPLVEHTWHWLSGKMEVAAFNADKADEMLLKRVPYYGISVATPFILMRHWKEWTENKTFEIDDKDRELCTLVMEIQHYCQLHYFGNMAQAYFDNSERDDDTNRRRASKYDLCYEQLPETFTVQDVENVYGISNDAARATVCRLTKDGFVKRTKKGEYRKQKTSLM